MAPGCTNIGAHKKAEWPDPEAKKYFVEKPIFVRIISIGFKDFIFFNKIRTYSVSSMPFLLFFTLRTQV